MCRVVLAVGVLSILTWLFVAVPSHPNALRSGESIRRILDAGRARVRGRSHAQAGKSAGYSVNEQGEEAFKRLIALREVPVVLCLALVREFDGMRHVDAHTIRQYGLASAAVQIENPVPTKPLA